MEDNSRRAIRRLLKTFGIQADEAMTAYLERHPEVDSIRVRITLENVAKNKNGQTSEDLRLVLEESIDRT